MSVGALGAGRLDQRLANPNIRQTTAGCRVGNYSETGNHSAHRSADRSAVGKLRRSTLIQQIGGLPTPLAARRASEAGNVWSPTLGLVPDFGCGIYAVPPIMPLKRRRNGQDVVDNRPSFRSGSKNPWQF
jgi:hypothetical protein